VLDVLDPFNKKNLFICVILSMGRLFLYRMPKYINWGKSLDTQAHIKRVVENKIVKGFVVVVLNIRKAFIPCMWIIRVVHFEDMYNHHVNYFCLSMFWGMDDTQFVQFCLSWTKGWTKDTEKYIGKSNKKCFSSSTLFISQIL
jgi:hypothetical protein